MIYTRKHFVEALERLKRTVCGEEKVDDAQIDRYAVGYRQAIDDVLTIIESEGGCFRE